MKKLLNVLSLVLVFMLVIFNCNIASANQIKSPGKTDVKSNEKVTIKWFGHSSFGISDKDGMEIVTDPYQFTGDYFFGYIFPKNISTKTLTISHEHFDHNNVNALKSYNCLIEGIGKFSHDGIDINGIASYHDENQGAVRGPNTIYTYNINGIKICHLGDLGHLLTEQEIEAIGKVDVLMIPVGGVYTIGSENAVKVVNQLNPKIVIPMHYKTDALIDDFGPLEKVDNFISKLKDWKVEKLDSLELTENDLNEFKGNEIVILSYK